MGYSALGVFMGSFHAPCARQLYSSIGCRRAANIPRSTNIDNSSLDEHEAEQLDEQEQRQDEQEAEAGGSSSTATSGVYQRGAARLPDRPIPEALRPVIRPVGQKYVTFIFFATTYDRITMETNSFFLITYAGLERSWSQVLTKGCPMASWVFSAGNTS